MVRRSVQVLRFQPPHPGPERVGIRIDGVWHKVHPFLAIAPLVRRSVQVLRGGMKKEAYLVLN
jgi:hypothetical protein